MHRLTRTRLSFVPIPALVVLIAGIFFTADPSSFFEPTWLLPSNSGNLFSPPNPRPS